VSTIDEGIELLTGVTAGTPDAKGNYPTDTVNGRVMKRLTELVELYENHQPDRKRRKEKEPKPRRPKPRKPKPEKKLRS
jgi:hypothetical protein